MAKTAHRAAVICRSVSLGAVLDDDQMVFGRKIHDWIHIARHPTQMYADDGLGSTRQGRLDGFRGNVLRVGIDVGEDGRSLRKDHT